MVQHHFYAKTSVKIGMDLIKVNGNEETLFEVVEEVVRYIIYLYVVVVNVEVNVQVEVEVNVFIVELVG